MGTKALGMDVNTKGEGIGGETGALGQDFQ